MLHVLVDPTASAMRAISASGRTWQQDSRRKVAIVSHKIHELEPFVCIVRTSHEERCLSARNNPVKGMDSHVRELAHEQELNHAGACKRVPSACSHALAGFPPGYSRRSAFDTVSVPPLVLTAPP